jgi:ABC-type transporter Mla subunit MlaD
VLANTREQKKEELQLVLEVSDIIDELNSVTRLLMVQRDTILNATSTIFYGLPREILNSTLKNLEHYTSEIETMTNDAKRTYDSVSTCTQ